MFFEYTEGKTHRPAQSVPHTPVRDPRNDPQHTDNSAEGVERFTLRIVWRSHSGYPHLGQKKDQGNGYSDAQGSQESQGERNTGLFTDKPEDQAPGGT